MTDLVMPYVNNKDKVWRKTYKDFCKSHTEYKDKADELDNERFRDDYNLIDLNLQLIKKCLPFVRKRYLVISNPEQVKGLDVNGFEIVLHKDIMPESILPTFNSSVIEMFIGNIKGLADKFIYINDDMIPLRVMQESDFFTDTGDAKMNIYTLHETTNNSLFRELCVNEYRAVFKGTDAYMGDDFYVRPEHSASALLKDCVLSAFEKHKDYIMANTEPFRTAKQFNQYLYIYEALLQDRIVPSDLKFLYFKMRSRNFLENCYKICAKDGSQIDWICANDDLEDNALEDKPLRYKVLRKALTLCLEYLNKGDK